MWTVSNSSLQPSRVITSVPRCRPDRFAATITASFMATHFAPFVTGGGVPHDPGMLFREDQCFLDLGLRMPPAHVDNVQHPLCIVNSPQLRLLSYCSSLDLANGARRRFGQLRVSPKVSNEVALAHDVPPRCVVGTDYRDVEIYTRISSIA